MSFILPQPDFNKVVVGFDISRPQGEPDKTPTGTSVLNGPVICGDVKKTQNDYEGVLNVSSDSVIQLVNDQQPKLDVKLAAKVDGNMIVEGDNKTKHALLISGGSDIDTVHIIGDLHVTGSVDCLSKGRLEDRHKTADGKPPKSFDIGQPFEIAIISA